MWLCLRKFPPLGLHKRIMNFPCLLILLIHTKHKNNKMKSWTDATSWFRVPTDLFLLFAHDISTNVYDPLSFILSLCTTIQTKLGSSLIYFFYLDTTIWQKYMIVFHLFFLCAWPFNQKLGSSLLLFFICARRPFDQVR